MQVQCVSCLTVRVRSMHCCIDSWFLLSSSTERLKCSSGSMCWGFVPDDARAPLFTMCTCYSQGPDGTSGMAGHQLLRLSMWFNIFNALKRHTSRLFCFALTSSLWWYSLVWRCTCFGSAFKQLIDAHRGMSWFESSAHSSVFPPSNHRPTVLQTTHRIPSNTVCKTCAKFDTFHTFLYLFETCSRARIWNLAMS